MTEPLSIEKLSHQLKGRNPVESEPRQDNKGEEDVEEERAQCWASGQQEVGT